MGTYPSLGKAPGWREQPYETLAYIPFCYLFFQYGINRIPLSAGGAELLLDESANDLLARADAQLYANKHTKS
jgi:hypothetical protein